MATDHDAPDIVAELGALLRSPARFVGVMGSARHTAAHLEALRSGCTDAELDRLRTPVGLDLGGRTPAEIALSILAGMLAARTGHAGGWLDRTVLARRRPPPFAVGTRRGRRTAGDDS